MFKTIRRNSKQLLESRRRSIASTTQKIKQPSSPTLSRTNFFDLPAELRNVIYEHIACETSILVPLPSTGKKSTKVPQGTCPSLILASKQTRRECIPLLLEHGKIQFQVHSFQFENILRIIRSLYSSELKALRRNGRLTIKLHMEKMNRDTLASLRRWLVDRSTHLDRLNFSYTITWPKHSQIIPTSTQVHKVNIYMQRRAVLSQALEAMSHLWHNVEEALQFELQPIINVLEEEQVKVGRDPGLPWRDRDDQALMIFGIPMSSSMPR